MDKITLQELLSMTVPCELPDGNIVDIIPEFRISVQYIENEEPKAVQIIVHADGYDSKTLDFLVVDNLLITNS